MGPEDPVRATDCSILMEFTLHARYVYEHEARRFLGKGPMMGLFGAGEWVRGKGHAMKSQWNAAMAAVDLMQVSNFHARKPGKYNHMRDEETS